MTHNYRILAIDSATTLCSVAVQTSHKTVSLVSSEGEKHTEVLLGMITQALKEADETLNSLDAVVFGAGPGAFTGLRVSCGIAQGLGWALNKPLVAVGNLHALAYSALSELEEGEHILIAVDARMHECYCAVYEKISSDAIEILPPCLLSPLQVREEIILRNVRKVGGNAFTTYATELKISDDLRLPDLTVANAEMMLIPGARMLSRAETVSPQDAHPYYVRNHVAQTIEERKSAKLSNV